MKMSDNISSLAKALTAFQAEVKNPANTAANPFFKSKYAPLPDILNIVRPLLSRHGLSIVQMPSGDGENITVATLLLHESGEWIEACPLTLRADKTTAQGAGSAITYGRRYAVSALLGISSEDDDDGNEASKPQAKPEQQGEKRASEATLKKIYAMAKELGLPAADMKEVIYGLTERESSKDLTPAEATKVIEYLEAQKGVPA